MIRDWEHVFRREILELFREVGERLFDLGGVVEKGVGLRIGVLQ